MLSSTLVTFRFVHEHAFSVDLLGSWDNFTTPIPLKRDKRRSHDEWTVCPTFKHTTLSRHSQEGQTVGEDCQGGLQQGETYWYYYIIDGDEECCDPMEVTTTACAMLPGQKLNVLNVPHDLDPRGQDAVRLNGFGLSPWTLDPNARFQIPKPTSTAIQVLGLERPFTTRSSASSRKSSYRAWSSVSWARPFTTWISQSLHRKSKSASAVDDDPSSVLLSRPAIREAPSRASDAVQPIESEFSAMQLGPDGMSLIRRIPMTYSTESIATITEETAGVETDEQSFEQGTRPGYLPLPLEGSSKGCESSNPTKGLPLLSPSELSSTEDYFDIGSPSFASTVPSTTGLLTPRRLSDAAHYFEPLTPILSATAPKAETEAVGHHKDGPTPMERFLDEFDYLGSIVF